MYQERPNTFEAPGSFMIKVYFAAERKRNDVPMKKKLVLFLILGMLAMTGCEGAAGAGTEESGTKAIGKEESAGFEEEKTVSSTAASEETAEEKRYTWQEITVTLPKEWEDRYVIVENENGFSVCQKASYEKDTSLGFICGFERTTELAEYGIGVIMFAYTDEGILYNLIMPMDVNCDVEQEEIAKEYVRMCGQVAEVKASVEIAASGIHYDAEEYVLPTSHIFPVNQEILANMSDNSLWIARNEIYARHGRQFKSEYLQRYFNRCTWYEGTIPAEQFEESALSQLEKENLKLLVAAEAEYDRQHPYPKKYNAAEIVKEDLSGDGTKDKVVYQVTEKENGELQCQIAVNGEKYNINELIYMDNPVAEIFYITDISEGDGELEIAVLDYGPSDDLVTFFFRYGETLSYIGAVSGFPFAEENGGINGFDGVGNIIGSVRTDLIETIYLKGTWRYEDGIITYQDTEWHDFPPAPGHILYEDIPVHCEKSEASKTTIIPAQAEVFFIGSDMQEWILVKGKDGSEGYMQVKDGIVAELNKPAEQVFSDLYFFD